MAKWLGNNSRLKFSSVSVYLYIKPFLKIPHGIRVKKKKKKSRFKPKEEARPLQCMHDIIIIIKSQHFLGYFDMKASADCEGTEELTVSSVLPPLALPLCSSKNSPRPPLKRNACSFRVRASPSPNPYHRSGCDPR